MMFLLAFIRPLVWAVFISIGISCALTSTSLGQSKPNIVLINLDDADVEQFSLSFSDVLFPNIMQMAGEGMSFRNLHVTTPICGPSRACLYRGQYAHNTQICVNAARVETANGFNGGFKFYRDQGFLENDLSVWMHNAGYRTMMVGKYLHHDFQPYVPPGWDDYYNYLGASYYETWRFFNRTNRFGSSDRLPPNVYRTVSETDEAVRLLEEHVARKDGKPFFLNLNPFGPHLQTLGEPFMTERHHDTWWLEAQQPYSRAYDEIDFSDKRGFFKNIPRLNAGTQFHVRKHYRERMLATRSVDDMVGRVRQALENLGVADNTYLFVTSDNGFELGHHRFVGKGVPTDRSSRVPLFVIGPDVQPGQTSDHLLGHIDLAPTIVELAKGTTPSFVDGKSFVRLLKHHGNSIPPPIRDVLLIENWEALHAGGSTHSTASTSARFPHSIYTEWANGDRDFYDLLVDPEQLDNSYDSLSLSEKTLMRLTLRTLRNPVRLPRARFAMPFAPDQVLPLGSAIRGFGEDPMGVRTVKLAIIDPATNFFWNGANWQAAFTQVTAAVDNPDGQITQWTYSNLPTDANLPAGDMLAFVWAYDAEWEYGPPAWVYFRF